MARNESNGFGRFVAELRRRHVGRVTIAYAAVAFVLLQAGEIILPAFDLPDWGLRVLVVLVILGFPIALALAWVYEISPQGIRRTEALQPQWRGGRRGRLLPRVAFLGVVLIAVVAAGWWLLRVTVPEGGSARQRGPEVSDVALAEWPGSIRSLAVLPFENYSDEGTPDYFAAGMHEAVVAELSQITALRVVSRTSVMRYAGARKSVPEIARELSVDAVVEGSVLRADDRVRITIQLIHGPSDRHLWTNSYERELSDVIALQNEVARAIANEIQAEIQPEDDRTRLAAASSGVNPAAHEAYLQGRFEQLKGTPEALQEATRHYEAAVERDSSYAPAYTGLAGSQLLLGVRDPEALDSLLPRALEAAERAIELDPSSREARALVSALERRVSDEADSLAEKGQRTLRVELDSLVVPSPDWSFSFTEIGRQLQELAISDAVQVRIALGPERRVSIARRLAEAGQYESANRLLRRILDRDPTVGEAWDALARVEVMQDDYQGAVEVRREQVRRAEGAGLSREALAKLETAVRERGERGYWEWELEWLEEREAAGDAVSNVEYAAALSGLGRHQDAIQRLQRAHQLGESGLLSLPGDPLWDPLRADPRFQRILAELRRPPIPAVPEPPQP